MSKDSDDKKEKSKEVKIGKKEKKYIKNVWKSVSIASIILILILLAIIFSGMRYSGTVTETMSADDAAEKTLDFIKEYMVRPGTNVSVKDVSEEEGLYKITIELKMGSMSQDVESYVTKDGKLFFPQAVDMEKVKEDSEAQQQEQNQKQTQEVPKSDKPVAHAFVMSHCPFGLQFIKAYVPVMELLGDKADIQINFVNYIMHGKDEFNDNNRIYCIQKETPDKLTNYLRCYVENKGYETCLEEAGIDKTTIDDCIDQIDEGYNLTETFEGSENRFPPYPIEDDLNEEYGVRGSPTFVLNDKVISVTRSSEAIKEEICSSFNDPPAECEENLSTTSEQPGFGPIGEGSGASSSGSC